MFDLDAHESRHTPEPDLVPILDALVSVIFFLLLSTTFYELTKITLPPSVTSVVTDPMVPTPVAAKMMIAKKADNKLHIVLKWGGENPDVIEKTIERAKDNERSEVLEKNVSEIVAEFTKKYPAEKSIQLGLGMGTTYQEMITAMDGIRTKLQDIVLFSNSEVDAMINN